MVAYCNLMIDLFDQIELANSDSEKKVKYKYDRGEYNKYEDS